MKRVSLILVVGTGLCIGGSDASGRGFGGGFRGFSGGFHGFGGGYGGGRFSEGFGRSYGEGRGSGFNSFADEGRFSGSRYGSRTNESLSGWGGRSSSSTYDRTWTSASGASLSSSGTRNFGAGRYGATNWHSAFSGDRYTGDMHHYASVYGANGAHSTAYWSSGYLGTHAGYVRHGFGYYNCFHPNWYATHPGCWAAAGWAAGAAWSGTTYANLASYCGLAPYAPLDYDYGSSVVYQGDNVYVNGEDFGTVQQYADQATTIASQGQTSDPPATDDWKPLGVFALVQGDEKTSNYIFQLAVDKDGIIRGNYYDGLLDATTKVFGSVDKKAQRAAWTIGKSKDRVFEAGIYDLTKPECTCLLHVGGQKTNQMMLVRVEPPKNGAGTSPKP
jgi:hypothetical protein